MYLHVERASGKEVRSPDRTVEISALVETDDPWKLAGLESLATTGKFRDFAIVEETESGKTYRTVFFRVAADRTGSVLREALLELAKEFERIGFRNNGILVVKGETLELGDGEFVETDAEEEVRAIEAEEARTGETIDVTQARQAVERILRKT